MPRILPDVWDVPERLRERVGTRAGRQRAMLHEGHALLLLHALPADGERERRAAIFWRDAQGTWRSAPAQGGAPAMRAHLDAFASRLEQLDDRVEEAKSASDLFEVLKVARPILRTVRNAHAALQQLREGVPSDAEVLAWRDRAYEIERLAGVVVEDAEAAMQFMVARRSEEQARLSERIAIESHRLNLLAAVCLPITALGAVLGVNLPSGLELLPEPASFWTFVGLAFVLGLVLRARVQKHSAPAPA